MNLLLLGLNHVTAPLAVRERVAFQNEALPAAIQELLALPDVQEAMILSTCNRSEIYCVTTSPAQVQDWLMHYHTLGAEDLLPYLYTRHDEAVVQHAFRVASGLDSMVLGEPQILGQMKQATQIAHQMGGVGSLLNPLFQHTFSVAKEIRTSTGVGTSSVSMAAAAVKLAQRIFGDLTALNILFVGAGDMVELCATHFARQRPARITVANRSMQRAEDLAQQLHGEAILFSALPKQLAQYDIVVSCTASQLPILGLGMIERAIKVRKHRPMFIVDLAVPRDVEMEVAQLDDVFLYTVDELAEVVQEGAENRQQAASEAEEIVTRQVQQFMHWLESRATVPLIRALRNHTETLCAQELDKALKALQWGEDPATVLTRFGNALTNKFLHAPSRALQSSAADERAHLEQMLRNFYHLP